jgi:hypothetical protein
MSFWMVSKISGQLWKSWRWWSGQLTAIRIPDMIKTVQELISTDRWMTLQMMKRNSKLAEKQFMKSKWKIKGRSTLGLFHTIWLINKMFSHCKLVKEFIQSVDDHALLDSTVMGEETWCFQYDPQTKRQSMEWHWPSSPRHKKFRFQKSKNKVKLVAFFDDRGIIHKEFVPPGQTWIRNIMWKYCLICFKEFVKTSVSGERKLAPLAWQCKTHTAVSIKQFFWQNEGLQN